MRLSRVFLGSNSWTQNANARDKSGNPVDINKISVDQQMNKNPIRSFSLYGAIAFYFSFENRPEERYRILEKIRGAIKKYTGKNYSVAEFNNKSETTYSDIKKVIEIAERK